MKIKPRNKIDTTFSMSSMTDIVFLLLIFFLLTANTPNALDLLLPKAKGKSTSVENIAVSIDKNFNLFINKTPTSYENFEEDLKQRIDNIENPIVILRSEETVPIEKVVFIMDIANQNNYKIILAVRPK